MKFESRNNKKCSSRIIFFYHILCGLFGAIIGNPVASFAEVIVGPHGGQVVETNGTRYEVLNNVREEKIQIYTDNPTAIGLPSSLVVKMKAHETFLDRFHLTFIPEVEPGNSHSSGRVPASILISGGITFEINF